MRRYPRIVFAALAAYALALPCQAQDRAFEPSDSPTARAQSFFLAPAACSERGLGLCLTSPEAAAAPQTRARPASKPHPQGPGRLSRFAHLAGIFMGRVDAARVGNFSLRFQLTIE